MILLRQQTDIIKKIHIIIYLFLRFCMANTIKLTTNQK